MLVNDKLFSIQFIAIIDSFRAFPCQNRHMALLEYVGGFIDN